MSLTVIDVGCADWGGDQSVKPLLDEFHPDALFGFDPMLDGHQQYYVGDCLVTLYKRAAALQNGTIEYEKAGLGSHVERGSRYYVRCADLREVIRNVIDGSDLILKMDAEMSEYELLPALMKEGLDERIKLLLIEWHCPWCRNGEWSHSSECERGDQANHARLAIEKEWRGEMREWTR